MEDWDLEEWEMDLEEPEDVLKRTSWLGIRAFCGHSALLPIQNGEPWYIEGSKCGKWLALISDVFDAEQTPVKDLQLVRLTDIFRRQVEGGIGEGIVIDPFTHPLRVSNEKLLSLLEMEKLRTGETEKQIKK